jgi:arylsulfatase A-like enzyme
LGTEPEFHPVKQGFDSYYGMPCNFTHSPRFFDGKKEVFARTPLDRLTELYTRRITTIIREQKEKPFFLYYAHNYPHTPYRAGKMFEGSSQDGVRGDVIQELDWSIGEMMKALKEAGISDNTVVIFTSDNGPTANKYATPFRGTKYVTFEGGHRVPFILHWPARIKQGDVLDVPINAMDVFPTLSEIIEVAMPQDRTYDGVSLMPLLMGKPLARQRAQPFFYYNCENLQAVWMSDWKLHLPRELKQLPFWDKNKAFVGIDYPVLYNLRTDREETSDLASADAEIVQEMSELAESIRKELGEYIQRGSGQRRTGSVVPGAPVISHEKDGGMVDPAMAEAIARERQKRHPDENKKKVRPRRKKQK